MINIYIDEAGRWPLAGPLYVGAILPLVKKSDFKFFWFKDSKQCNEKKREVLFDILMDLQKKNKILIWIWSVSAKEIDKWWMTKSMNQAIKRAISWLVKNGKKYSLIIDGNRDFGLKKDLWVDVETIVKWDQKVVEISMASIAAKVSRDRIMVWIHKKHPQYQFAKHKGYWTQLHIDLIKKHGPSSVHRKLFLRKIIPDSL